MTPRNSNPHPVHDKPQTPRPAGPHQDHGRPAGRHDRIAWAIVMPQSPAGKTPRQPSQ